MKTTLAEIVIEAQQGNQEALQELYQQFGKSMFNICTRMAADRDDAEDILQDAFMQAFKNLKQLKEPDRFGGWLKRIVINKCIHFCKSKMQYAVLDGNEHENKTDDEPTWWTGIKLDDIHNAIKTLPDGCRVIFSLYAIEDYSHKQIAESLNVSEGTSKSQYFRAKALLKQLIIKKAQSDGSI